MRRSNWQFALQTVHIIAPDIKTDKPNHPTKQTNKQTKFQLAICSTLYSTNVHSTLLQFNLDIAEDCSYNSGPQNFWKHSANYSLYALLHFRTASCALAHCAPWAFCTLKCPLKGFRGCNQRIEYVCLAAATTAVMCCCKFAIVPSRHCCCCCCCRLLAL